MRETDRYVRARLDQEIWFGWSFRNGNIASTRKNISLHPVFGQWRLSGDFPAILRLVQIGTNEGDFKNCRRDICTPSQDQSKDVVVELQDMANSYQWGKAENRGYVCRLFSMKTARERWVDIVVNTNFGTNASGFLKIWVDGELACDYRGQLVVKKFRAAFRNRPGHRRGIFVSYTRRWDSVRGSAPKPTMIVYYDEFRRGRKRSDVDTRLREEMGYRPVD